MPVSAESDEWTVVRRIRSRTRITRPGIYKLERDIRHGGGTVLSETCIRIASDNVVLDGGGHTVDGRGVSDTTGIAVTAKDELENVAVLNLTITDWDRGLFLENVAGGVVRNVHAVHNGQGISLENARSIVLDGNHVSDNLLGVYLDSKSDANWWDNTVESNHGTDVYHPSTCDD